MWEQHDWQIPSLASRTHQTLDNTCHPSLGPRSSFRFIPQPYRSGRGKRSAAQQLIVLKRQVKRPQLTDPDRFRLVFLSMCWLLIHPPGFVRWNGIIMLFSLVNFWERHDEEISFLASRAYQKLDQTCHASLDHGFIFRPNTQSYRSNCRKCVVRQQLIILKRQVKRPQLSNPDRIRLVLLSHFAKFWKQTLHIIQPDTLLSWHRNLFRNDWRRKSQLRHWSVPVFF